MSRYCSTLVLDLTNELCTAEEHNLNQFGAAHEITYTKQCQVWDRLLHHTLLEGQLMHTLQSAFFLMC